MFGQVRTNVEDLALLCFFVRDWLLFLLRLLLYLSFFLLNPSISGSNLFLVLTVALGPALRDPCLLMSAGLSLQQRKAIYESARKYTQSVMNHNQSVVVNIRT